MYPSELGDKGLEFEVLKQLLGKSQYLVHGDDPEVDAEIHGFAKKVWVLLDQTPVSMTQHEIFKAFETLQKAVKRIISEEIDYHETLDQWQNEVD